MRVIRGAWALACKDLRVEARAREAFATMLFFAALVLLVFNFALEPGSAALREAAGGLLWVAFLFTGMLALGRTFQAERENECLEALVLTPAPREAIFFGKFAGNLVVMLAAEALILLIFAVLLNMAKLDPVTGNPLPPGNPGNPATMNDVFLAAGDHFAFALGIDYLRSVFIKTLNKPIPPIPVHHWLWGDATYNISLSSVSLDIPNEKLIAISM
jgi:hypothetical protein